MGYPEQYEDTELNPAPGDGLDMDCRGGNHRGCAGPPATRCGCSCHVAPAARAVMDELIAFARARLDEDEALAKAAAETWIPFSASAEWRPGTPLDPLSEHIARHDPARVLREAEAGRAILARCEFARNQVAVGAVNEDAGYGPADPGWPLRADSHELDVRSLAAVWSDHPGYPDRWPS